MTTIDRTTARLAVVFSDALEHERVTDSGQMGAASGWMTCFQSTLSFALDYPDEARELLKLIESQQAKPVIAASREVAHMLHELWSSDERISLDEAMQVSKGHIERWVTADANR